MLTNRFHSHLSSVIWGRNIYYYKSVTWLMKFDKVITTLRWKQKSNALNHPSPHISFDQLYAYFIIVNLFKQHVVLEYVLGLDTLKSFEIVSRTVSSWPVLWDGCRGITVKRAGLHCMATFHLVTISLNSTQPIAVLDTENGMRNHNNSCSVFLQFVGWSATRDDETSYTDELA